MTKAKTNYKRKCKARKVMFYLNEHDQALYNFSKTLNFQAFVKNALIDAMNERKE